MRLPRLPFSVLACLLTLAAGRLAAQAPADSGDQRLPAEELKSQEKLRFDQLANGSQAVGPQDKPILDKAARWMVYRVTWTKYQERQPDDGVSFASAKSTYDVIVRDLYPHLIVPDPKRPNWKPNDNQWQFMVQFTDSLMAAIDKVLENPRPIARVNAGLILLKVSETGQEKIADLCMKILEDPKQLDAVKLYTVKALRNVFKGEPFHEVEREPFVDKDREARCIKDLVAFMTRKPEGKRLSPGEIDAFRFLRRAAIATVGETRYPAVAQRRVVLSRPAFELLKIVRNDGVEPEPTPAEQVEAAVGVCKMLSRNYGDYQADYAAYQLGQYLLEYGEKYEAERNAPGGTLSRPWRSDSARLDQALAVFERDRLNSKSRKIVTDGRTMLQSIVAGGQAAQLRELRLDLGTPPAETSVYRNQPDTAIRGAAPSGE